MLFERSADATAKWLRYHPEIEVVSRDRRGLYAQGAARGAHQARQVADRLRLLDNLRLTIEQQLNRERRDINRPVIYCRSLRQAAMPAAKPNSNTCYANGTGLTLSDRAEDTTDALSPGILPPFLMPAALLYMTSLFSRLQSSFSFRIIAIVSTAQLICSHVV